MDIYVDGLERSGNVFLTTAIALTTGMSIISTRSHSTETLKNYNKENPFVVPVRDALDCITSTKIYLDKVVKENIYEINNNGQDSGREYAKVYNIIKRHSEYIDYLLVNPKFFIAPFSEFTRDHNKVIRLLTKMHPSISMIRYVSYPEIAAHEDKNVFYTELGNLPRATPKKEEVKSMLKQEYFKEIEELQSKIDMLYKRYYERCRNFGIE